MQHMSMESYPSFEEDPISEESRIRINNAIIKITQLDDGFTDVEIRVILAKEERCNIAELRIIMLELGGNLSLYAYMQVVLSINALIDDKNGIKDRKGEEIESQLIQPAQPIQPVTGFNGRILWILPKK